MIRFGLEEPLAGFLVPLNFVSVEGSHLSEEKSFTAEDMLPEHWQVIGECLEHNAQVSKEIKDSIRMEGPIKGGF